MRAIAADGVAWCVWVSLSQPGCVVTAVSLAEMVEPI